MNTSSNQSLTSVVGSWIVNPKAKRRASSSPREYLSEEMVEVCRGKEKTCKLMYNTVSDEYHTMYDCHRGSLCTEFRIMKVLANENAIKNSKDTLVKDFSVFRTL